ncbi:hypothetical protein EJ08DRAFT_729160 [Tothia fuscella]|uniref:Uncharacterized protein n=1 Tax=Tothia fuscella TaxID=1048955 RepID=A0A9P4P3H9_9PEZI|nr:hypothetical protein EJ08DRAFT_729160 [Tothia fuscella]
MALKRPASPISNPSNNKKSRNSGPSPVTWSNTTSSDPRPLHSTDPTGFLHLARELRDEIYHLVMAEVIAVNETKKFRPWVMIRQSNVQSPDVISFSHFRNSFDSKHFQVHRVACNLRSTCRQIRQEFNGLYFQRLEYLLGSDIDFKDLRCFLGRITPSHRYSIRRLLTWGTNYPKDKFHHDAKGFGKILEEKARGINGLHSDCIVTYKIPFDNHGDLKYLMRQGEGGLVVSEIIE